MDDEGHEHDERAERSAPLPTRRDALDIALELGVAVWAAGVAIPAAVYLWPAGSTGPTRKYVDVDVADLPAGKARVVEGGAKPLLVVHEASGEFRVLSAVCTHLGCIVHWSNEEKHILCPCHAGVFAPDGSVVSGPPQRPLPSYPCRLVGDRLRVET